jgi:hypothetical protein
VTPCSTNTTNTLRGVGFLVLSLLIFSLQDIAVKSGLGLAWASGMYLVYREQRAAARGSAPPVAAATPEDGAA